MFRVTVRSFCISFVVPFCLSSSSSWGLVCEGGASFVVVVVVVGPGLGGWVVVVAVVVVVVVGPELGGGVVVVVVVVAGLFEPIQFTSIRSN